MSGECPQGSSSPQASASQPKDHGAGEGAASPSTWVPASCQGIGRGSSSRQASWCPSRQLKDSLGPGRGDTTVWLQPLCPICPPILSTGLGGAPTCTSCLTFQKPQLSPRVTSPGPHSQDQSPFTLGAPTEAGSTLRSQQ